MNDLVNEMTFVNGTDLEMRKITRLILYQGS